MSEQPSPTPTLERLVHEYVNSQHCACNEEEACPDRGFRERAAAALADSATGPLDVERLALAICKGLGIRPEQADAEPIFANAPFIAREIAALASQSSGPTTDELAELEP